AARRTPPGARAQSCRAKRHTGRELSSAQEFADGHGAPSFGLNLEDLKNPAIPGGDRERIAACLDNGARSRVGANVADGCAMNQASRAVDRGRGHWPGLKSTHPVVN